MKNKTIRYPVQAAIALSWLCLGGAWLFHRPLTGGQIIMAVLLIGVALLMLVDATAIGHRYLNQILNLKK